ncbi:MAG: nucleotide exchange factor GrpE, partial [Thermoplasmata archaeon]
NRKDELAKKDAESLAEVEPAPLAVQKEDGASEAEDETAGLKRRLAEQTELAQGYFAQLQRVQADFENYQKRVAAERSRIADGACETIVAGLLETLDDFERAIVSLEKLPEGESQGVRMVYQNMLEYLRRNGLERIAAAGCQFDPHKHEAIMQAESEEAGDGTVLEEFQAGYAMKGKVIRPSKVKVAREKKKIEDNNIQKEE